jgi:hypothetical protein
MRRAKSRATPRPRLRPANSYAASSTPSRLNPGSVSRVSLDAAQETRGRHQHDERERHSRCHQRVAKRALAARTRAGVQRGLRIDAGELQRGPNAKITPHTSSPNVNTRPTPPGWFET